MQRTNYDFRSRGRVAVLAALLAVEGCQSTNTASPIDQVSTHDGLVKADIKGVDAVYRKPGFDLSQYNRILLRPVEVSFSKHFKPEKDSMLYNMNKVDREKIQTELAELFHETFKESQGAFIFAFLVGMTAQASRDSREARRRAEADVTPPSVLPAAGPD